MVNGEKLPALQDELSKIRTTGFAITMEYSMSEMSNIFKDY